MPRHPMLERLGALALLGLTAVIGTAGCLLVPAPVPVVRRPVIVAPPPPVVVAPGPYYYYPRGYGRYYW